MTIARILMAGLLAAGLSVISILVALPAHAADAVVIEGQELRGFARLKFQWPDAVKVDVQETNGVIVLKFARPFQARLEDLPQDLPNYIALARQDADGTTLRLALKFPFRTETLTAANEVYVNLMPETWRKELPGLPADVLAREQAARLAAEQAEAARKALTMVALPDIPVRSGSHDTYSRIVFDWPDDVDYKVARDGTRLDLSFSAPGHLKIGRLRVDPPPFLVDAETSTDAKSAKLRLTVSADAEFRIFREETRIVLDLTASNEDGGTLTELNIIEETFQGTVPEDAASADQFGSPAPLLQTQAAAGTGAPATGNAPTAQVATPATGSSPAAPSVTMIDPRRIGRPKAARVVKDSGYAAAAPAAGTTAGETHAAAGHGEGAAGNTVVADAPIVPIDTLQVDTPRIVKPAGDAGPGAAEAAADADSQDGNNDTVAEASAEASSEVDGGDMASADNLDSVVATEEVPTEGVVVRREGDSVTFTFADLWRVPAAVFERADYVWVVFETNIDIAAPELTREHTSFVDAVDVVQTTGLRGLRLRLADDALVTAAYDNGQWKVSVGKTILKPPGPLAIRRGVEADGGGKLYVVAPDAGEAHKLTDPDIGDTLVIVPVPGPARGVLSPRQTVDLEVLASAHGLVFRPIADDVVIGLNDKGEVAASRRSGLVLTANPRRPAAAALGRQNNIFSPGLVGFELASGKEEDFHSRLAALNGAIAAAATPDERKDARMALVRFYLGYEFGTEALGVLSLMADARKDQISDPEFKMLRGIAKYFIGRLEEASEDLAMPALLYDPNAALWRTLVGAERQLFVETRPDVERGRTVNSDYSPLVQARFHLAAARIALGVKDIASAETDLRKVPDDALDEELFAERTLLAGRLAEVTGETEDALSLYEQAVALDYRPVSARATLAKAGLLRQFGSDETREADLAAAIETLDGLRFSWRGGDVELDAAAELARIYEEQNDYRSALSVMRSVATQFPSAEKGRAIGDQMMALFRRLFLDGEVDNLKPLEALSLFYDFRELTPVGRDGDRMIRSLADRLVAVDLLDQAVEMLDHQVTHRLHGVARAQVAGRLAAVHLLNREPAKALGALRKTRQAQLPTQVSEERLLLEAKALSALGRHDHALELLADNKSEPARSLTADVLWESGDYRGAGRALENLLGLRWTRDDPLSADEQFDVLRAAIGYVLAEDEEGVERVRQKYAEKMAQGPQAASFSIVASSSDGRGIAFRDLAREIAQVDTLERFMVGYRARYEAEQSGESAIN